MNSISVAIVDDDGLIVSLLEGFLQQQKGIKVCSTFECGETFIKNLSVQEIIPDVLVLDLKMKKMNGIKVTEWIKLNYPDMKIIVITSHYKKSFIGFMLKTGVAAFVPKGISPQKLIDIIKEVYQKGFFLMQDQFDIIKKQVSVKTPQPVTDDLNVLTERELEVLKLICLQKTAKEIGEELFIAARTVEGHKNKLFEKTGAKNIAGLVLYAVQNNFIEPHEIII